jgi:hypothetical protein
VHEELARGSGLGCYYCSYKFRRSYIVGKRSTSTNEEERDSFFCGRPISSFPYREQLDVLNDKLGLRTTLDSRCYFGAMMMIMVVD